MSDSLGLVGGTGGLPALMAGEARRAGWRVVAFAIGDPAGLAGVAHRVVPCRVGEMAPVLDLLVAERIRHVVLAGSVRKDGLFHGMSLDPATRALADRSPDWSDTALLRTATSALAALGIEVLDQRAFLAPWLAPAGHVGGPPLPEAVRSDVGRGFAVARELAARGVGQTVVLRAGSVAAVEAMEGTDEAVRRGLQLAGRGAVVVKAAAPDHDYRFDVPAVGGTTLAACAEGGAAALAVEAGRVLLLDRERVAAEAAQAGVSVVGITGSGAPD